MEDIIPSVIPTQNEVNQANVVSENERLASEEMERKTNEQIRLRNELLNVKQPIQQPTQVKQEPKIAIQMDAPYDLVPLPSDGLIYQNKNKHIKIAYLNASDENILTSPHLIESGKFLDILMRRKILDQDFDPKDLLPGDRMAIMIWLRGTAYGNNYPVQVINPNTGDLIETEIDLSTLKTKKLGVLPDRKGYFEFKFPACGSVCKFKLLTVGDIEELEELEELEKNTLEYANNFTNTLSKQIVEVDGISDREHIDKFISVLRIMDSRAIRKYISDIECGVDLNIVVQVPGGEPFTTFLPVNFSFFWPEL